VGRVSTSQSPGWWRKGYNVVVGLIVMKVAVGDVFCGAEYCVVDNLTWNTCFRKRMLFNVVSSIGEGHAVSRQRCIRENGSLGFRC